MNSWLFLSEAATSFACSRMRVAHDSVGLLFLEATSDLHGHCAAVVATSGRGRTSSFVITLNKTESHGRSIIFSCVAASIAETIVAAQG